MSYLSRIKRKTIQYKYIKTPFSIVHDLKTMKIDIQESDKKS